MKCRLGSKSIAPGYRSGRIVDRVLGQPVAAATARDRRQPATGPYFRRRFLRIFPAYWLVLVFVFFVFRTAPLHGRGDVFIYFGLVQIYSRSHILGGLTQAWSLSTEITFYLFLPIWAVLIRRVRNRCRPSC